MIGALLLAAAAAAGTWQPTSRALEPLGPLVVADDKLQWSICKAAQPRRLAGAGDGAATTYALEGAPGCVLDGRRLSHLRIAPRGDGCRAELSLYLSADDLLADRPEARGLVERSPCR